MEKQTRNVLSELELIAHLNKLDKAELVALYVDLYNKDNFVREQLILSKIKEYDTPSETFELQQLNIFDEKHIDEDVKPDESSKKQEKSSKRDTSFDKSKFKVIEFVREYKDLIDPETGKELVLVGEIVEDVLVHQKARTFIERNIIKQYKVKESIDHEVTTPNLVVPFSVNYMFENSIVSPSVITNIAYNKFVLCVPLYRQEKDYKNQGNPISRQTMSNWLIKTAEFYLKPIYDELLKEIRTQEVIHMDETTIVVIAKKNQRKKCYEWLASSGRFEEKQIRLYMYSETRQYRMVQTLIGDDYKGNVHSDGYPAYQDQLFLNIVCMAHVRRRFREAFDVNPMAKKYLKLETAEDKKDLLNVNPSLKDAVYILDLIRKMFNLDTNYSDLDERKKIKETKSKPLMEEFFMRLDDIESSYAKKTKMYEAISYALTYKKEIENYLLDPRFELSNNRAERDIKNFVMARKNFLFSKTERGAESNSIYMTLIQTAIANNLDAYDYLEYALSRIINEGMTDKVIQEILPYSEQAQRDVREISEQRRNGN